MNFQNAMLRNKTLQMQCILVKPTQGQFSWWHPAQSICMKFKHSLYSYHTLQRGEAESKKTKYPSFTSHSADLIRLVLDPTAEWTQHAAVFYMYTLGTQGYLHWVLISKESLRKVCILEITCKLKRPKIYLDLYVGERQWQYFAVFCLENSERSEDFHLHQA